MQSDNPERLDLHPALPESESADVERTIQEQERVNVASIKLPETGPIADELKVRVCQRVKTIMTQHNITLRALALQLGGKTHESILSQVLRRIYAHEDSDHIRRINAWAESIERRTKALRPAGICDTGVVRLLRSGCDYAKSQGCIVLLTGPAGIGKTNAAEVYAAEDMNAMYVRLQITHSSPTSFLRQVAETCRVDPAGSKSTIMDAIITKLCGSHRLLILDEWHLASRPLYEVVRGLYDKCKIPIALIGTAEVSKWVQSARLRRGSVWSDQFCSRIGWDCDLTKVTDESGQPRPLFTMEEIREIFRSDQIRISRDGTEYLQALACAVGLGCLRMAQRCYLMAARLGRRSNEITAAHLRKAFRRQAVPEGVDDAALVMHVEESLQQVRHFAAKAG